MDRLEELYENFIDRIINDYPLTTNRSSDHDDAININQQIINRISNIRRYLTDAEHTSQDVEHISQFVYQDNYSGYINEDEYGTFDDDVDRLYGTFTDGTITLNNMLTENTSFTDDVDRLQGTMDFGEENNYIIDTLFNYVVNTTFSDFTYTDLNELNDVKITLTKEQFDKFEKKSVSESDKLTNCSICMDNYKLDEKMIILKCNHTYHENCIENWLCNQKVTCPICRKDTREMLGEMLDT